MNIIKITKRIVAQGIPLYFLKIPSSGSSHSIEQSVCNSYYNNYDEFKMRDDI